MADKAAGPGIVLIDKAPGLTSFASLGICKKTFATKRVGHAGTLDLFAEGLLLVCIADATRLVPYFVGLDKTYIATIRFGLETDTLDPEGKVIATGPVPDESSIKSILPSFVGDILQTPPVFSAIHVNGKRAYERTLAGEIVEMEARPVRIDRIGFVSWQAPDLTIEIDCSSGTYIRSLARDIGLALDSRAHVVSLKRTRIGPFDISMTIRPPENFSNENWWGRAFVRGRELAEVTPGLRAVDLVPERIADFRNGKKLSDSDFSTVAPDTGDPLAVCADGRFLGIVTRLAIDTYSYQSVFANPI